MLNTSETWLDDKKETCEKKKLSYSYAFINNYMLVIISYCLY